MEKLTKRQEDALKFIKTYIVSHGYPPTVREIAEALGVNSPATIQAHLDCLANKGYIKKGNGKNRTIQSFNTRNVGKCNRRYRSGDYRVCDS